MKKTVQTIIQLMKELGFEIKSIDKNPADIIFKTDTDMDSLDKVELTMKCEDEFQIIIKDEYLYTFVTVGDLAKYLDEDHHKLN